MADEPLFDNFFENFTHSFAAARTLLEKAYEGGNLIEGLILYASSIDALLRNLVAIESPRRAAEAKGEELASIPLDQAFFEHDESHWFNERQMYDMALKNDVVDKTQYEQLNELYTFRNRVVHRFIISDIAYSDLGPRLLEYEKLYWQLYRKLEEIEQPSTSMPRPETDAVKGRILRKINRGKLP